ncbi:hypothetical protein DIPPA_30539 [Diplonema papillatum]|nr:hypothetical protein DIPPA_30539 [Diplonema papillatum]
MRLTIGRLDISSALSGVSAAFCVESDFRSTCGALLGISYSSWLLGQIHSCSTRPEDNLPVLSSRVPLAPAAVRTVYHLPPPPGAKQPGPCSIVSLSRGSHAPPVQAAAPAQLLPPSKRSAFSVVVVAPLDHLDHKGERPSCCMVDIEVAAVALDGVVAP